VSQDNVIKMACQVKVCDTPAAGLRLGLFQYRLCMSQYVTWAAMSLAIDFAGREPAMSQAARDGTPAGRASHEG
jgi:hypothetical protein